PPHRGGARPLFPPARRARPRRDVIARRRGAGDHLPPARYDEETGHMSTTTGLRQGDVGYAMLWTPDVARAAAFYHRLLGWRLSPGGSAQGRQVEGVTPPFGVWGGQERYTLFLCYAVDDVAEAIHRVRAAGG